MALLFFFQTYDKTGVFQTGTPPPYGMAGNHFTSISGKKNVFSGNAFPGNASAAPLGVGVSVGVGVGGQKRKSNLDTIIIDARAVKHICDVKKHFQWNCKLFPNEIVSYIFPVRLFPDESVRAN